MIFEEPRTAIVVGIILAFISFVVQLMLCFKAKKPMVKRIPLFIIVLFGLLILLIGTGIMGEGSGFLGNIHLMVSAILAIVDGIALIGIVVAWIVNKAYTQKHS